MQKVKLVGKLRNLGSLGRLLRLGRLPKTSLLRKAHNMENFNLGSDCRTEERTDEERIDRYHLLVQESLVSRAKQAGWDDELINAANEIVYERSEYLGRETTIWEKMLDSHARLLQREWKAAQEAMVAAEKAERERRVAYLAKAYEIAELTEVSPLDEAY